MTVNDFLLDVRDFLDFGGGLLIFPISIVIAVGLVLVPRSRRKRYWLSILILGLAGSVATTYEVYDRVLRRIANFYTYQLDRSRTFDGIAFPAGATVKVSNDSAASGDGRIFARSDAGLRPDIDRQI